MGNHLAMFKKRSVKKGAKRDKEDIVCEEKVEKELDQFQTLIDPEKENDDLISDKQTACNSESDTKSTEKVSTQKLFEPDTDVRERLEKMMQTKRKIDQKHKIQQVDKDGDKLYSGAISTKSRKEELVKPISTHIRENYAMDHQRDVCKDFLKNGYCGFGDTCKFLHVRDEFSKVKTPVERSWESAAKRRKKY